MKTKNSENNIQVVTLGCSKNLVDSELLMGQLKSNGIKVLHNCEPFEAATVIINTCGFIQDAKEESIDTILNYAKAKEQGKIKNLFVFGCLSQRYKEALQNEIIDVDQYFGTNSLKEIIATLGYNYKENLTGERYLTTPSHYAYLKISEGCNRKCSFCAIPIIRGNYNSRPVNDIINEAIALSEKGVKELILIAQDLSFYGTDLYQRSKLADLLKGLSSINNIDWIRLHYAYPAGFPMEILKVIQESKNICHYLDIPFQHISDVVLKKMRRGLTGRQTYNLIEILRSEIENLTLRTTLLVGHPGETDREFSELIEFVEKIRFERLGVFTYSEEEDTYAAGNYPDLLSIEEKEMRASRIMDAQRKISYELNSAKVGKLLKVIVDRKEGDAYIGRSEADSPEVDNEVTITSDSILETGKFYDVIITDAEEFDLIGRVK